MDSRNAWILDAKSFARFQMILELVCKVVEPLDLLAEILEFFGFDR